MTRTTLRRAVTAVSFLAVIFGGLTAPALAAPQVPQPMCWHDRCML